LPKEVEIFFRRQLKGKQHNGNSLSIAAADTVEAFLPAHSFDGKISDPKTALAFNVRQGNCRARGKIILALLSPFQQITTGVRITALNYTTAHFSVAVLDQQFGVLHDIDPQIVACDLDPIRRFYPVEGGHAEQLLGYEGLLEDIVSVAYQDLETEQQEYGLIAADALLDGDNGTPKGSEIQSIIAFGALAHRLIGEKGLGKATVC
jgi:hypothetical protein